MKDIRSNFFTVKSTIVEGERYEKLSVREKSDQREVRVIKVIKHKAVNNLSSI
jgi:hypothetical protein